MRDEDLSQWDTLVVMAGDGLLYEVRGTVGHPPSQDGHGARRRGVQGASFETQRQAGNGKGEMAPGLEQSGAAMASVLPWPEALWAPLPPQAVWGPLGSLPGPQYHELPPSPQVVNGLMERPDWEETMKKPLCILPGGSGNALAASINHYAG